MMIFEKFAGQLKIGAARSTSAIAMDLLTICADRDMYHDHIGDLFELRLDVVQLICEEGSVLLPVQLDDLVLRSRLTARCCAA